MADTVEDAALARGPFSDLGKVPVRTLAVLYSNYLHLATLTNTGISTVADLKGRVVSTGAPGSGTEVVAFRALEAFGLDPKKDLSSQPLGASQSVDALKDGKVQAFFFTGGLPTAAVLDLTHTPGITAKLVASDAAIPKMQEKYGKGMYYPVVIPKDTYALSEDVTVVGVANLLVVSETMPEQLAYDITRLLFEKQSDLAAIHPEARNLSLEKATEGSPADLHPGARRFYRERVPPR
jgi:TRAP transporter TAXI family solute receptor